MRVTDNSKLYSRPTTPKPLLATALALDNKTVVHMA
jgi:hypothetical protein